jgi:hypothetical protein
LLALRPSVARLRRKTIRPADRRTLAGEWFLTRSSDALRRGPPLRRVSSLRCGPLRVGQQSAHQHPQGRHASSGNGGSNKKRYAELRTDSTQIVDSELSVSVRLSEVSEKASKPAGENISRMRPVRGTTRR